ncbi:glycosyltransferase family 4 protein [Streptomyces sioyaensis]|uniref:glycosyltransferase family 4 protein n=1 Tax=Streptomyces sioyaensis TaxID=67364 RepID=UPI0037D3602C
MKISFLIHTVYGIGGTIRTTLNLAEELASRHEVEIVSVFRHRDTPVFAIDPRISVVPLVDTRPNSATSELEHPLHQQAAERFPRTEARFKEYSKLTDERVRDHYSASGADVVIGTRPGLVAYVAQFAPAAAVRVGQEHMTHNHHKAALRAEMYEHLSALDAFVTVSEGDATVYREKMTLPATLVLAIPNSVPEPAVAPSDGTSKTVVAAGRLAAVKEYHVLVEAFAKVAAARPDWVLRIYGGGDQSERLRKRIDELGLYNKIHLMGPHSPIEPEWAKGSIAVSSSRHESFGMTLVEAMRCGLPVVSTDCDYGPREILDDGTDGLLVPVGDVKAITKALLTLIDDEDRRREMGAAALRNARRFDPSQVAKEYEGLFGELTAAAVERAADQALAPVADCAMAASGELTVSLVAEQSSTEDAELRLLCSRRDDRSQERRFHFTADGTATIPAVEDLGEGVWDLFAERPGSGRRLHITGRVIDQRGAMHAAERGGVEAAACNRVPFKTKEKGALALRSWSRPVHAESADIEVADQRITLTGALRGAATVGATPTLELRRRGKAGQQAVQKLEFPGERQGERGFKVTIPCTSPAAQQLTAHDVWDVWLRYAPDAKPVKVGRILDDIVEKKDVFTYPLTILPKRGQGGALSALSRKVRGTPLEKVRVRLFYTVTNDLALNVVDLP